ncbi:MAG: leucyl/phenylalanyl-tRNA--protein transferase [Puniceicoccales bacterium]|jgi:leucyl/phenylalanyl-tRNA--protein transferase|nr:leucyl/phenylalanyl-tRNA--protein transferase [Puniceicoccales bacterium]
MIEFLHDIIFPDPYTAAEDEPLAWSIHLHPEQIKAAYKIGIFPWYGEETPVLWWSPDPRFILIPKEFKISKSLAKTLKNTPWRVTFDENFSGVIQACAETFRPNQDGTWITPEIIDCYTHLHREGIAHSVEVWDDEKLIGGLYGVALGCVFYGESMFYRERDASKVALATLVPRLADAGVRIIDCQQETQHLASFGAKCIPRKEFLDTIGQFVATPTSHNPWALSDTPE